MASRPSRRIPMPERSIAPTGASTARCRRPGCFAGGPASAPGRIPYATRTTAASSWAGGLAARQGEGLAGRREPEPWARSALEDPDTAGADGGLVAVSGLQKVRKPSPGPVGRSPAPDRGSHPALAVLPCTIVTTGGEHDLTVRDRCLRTAHSLWHRVEAHPFPGGRVESLHGIECLVSWPPPAQRVQPAVDHCRAEVVAGGGHVVRVAPALRLEIEDLDRAHGLDEGLILGNATYGIQPASGHATAQRAAGPAHAREPRPLLPGGAVAPHVAHGPGAPLESAHQIDVVAMRHGK